MSELRKCNEDDNKLLELAWRCCFLAQRMMPGDLANISIERLGAICEALNLIAIPEEYNSESAMELYQKNASFHALCATLHYAYRAADRLAEEKAREALGIAVARMQRLLDEQDHCGSYEHECPLHDAHKDYDIAGELPKLREALRLLEER